MFWAGLLIGAALGYIFCGLLTANERRELHAAGNDTDLYPDDKRL